MNLVLHEYVLYRAKNIQNLSHSEAASKLRTLKSLF